MSRVKVSRARSPPRRSASMATTTTASSRCCSSVERVTGSCAATPATATVGGWDLCVLRGRPHRCCSACSSPERLQIPPSELQRFADEICPALRNVATVVSTDGSFAPPEISAPALVLRASYGAGHDVEVGWEWAYKVGATTQRAPLAVNGAGPGFRDLDAERTILADTVLTATGLERLGLLDGSGRPADAPPVSLSGLESMRLTTEDLPRLAQLPGVAVKVEGEPADYRDVADSLEIGVSTANIAG